MGNRSSMTMTLRCRLSASLVAFAFWMTPFDFQAQTDQSLQAQIKAGGKLFSGSCSNSYCHGSAGSGGGGPKLKDRSFTADHLTRVITEGIPGTGMPGFKSTYDRKQIAQIVVYVLSLSPNNPNAKTPPDRPSGPVDGHFNPSAPRAEGESTPAAPKPEETGKAVIPADESADIRGDAAAGRELFFGASQIDNCRVCHTVNAIGGKIGPDLTSIVNQSPRQILQSIVSPSLAIAEKYQMIVLTTRDGMRFAGVKRDENDLVIRLYDTSTLPPVSRAFAKSEVTKIERVNRSSMPADYGSKYSLKQLLDLISFLKSNDPAKSVSVGSKDLF